MDRRRTVIECDSLVVGSGAGGAVAARELALAGRAPVVVEEGPEAPDSDLAARSPAENMRRLYRDAGLSPIHGRPAIAFGEGRCVGGTTVVNGGLLWHPPADLLARWARRFGIDGYLAEHLAPHAREITRRLSVHTHPERAPANRDSHLLALGADALGWHTDGARRAIRECRHSNRCATGCPTGAKQSMALTYLPEARRAGARVHPNTRVVRLVHHAGVVTEVHAVGPGGRLLAYRPEVVFLAAGALCTPVLLQRSRVHERTAGRHTAFHVNVRLNARFAEPVRARDATIFTTQLREFAKLGILVMPANLTPGTLAAGFAGHPPHVLEGMLADIDRVGTYTAQVRMSGPLRIRALPGGGRLLRHRIRASDRDLLRFAVEQAARVLFAAGAVEVYAPERQVLRGVDDVDTFAARADPRRWDLVSVHAMASCPMGGADRGGMCDPYGRPYGLRNLHICDAAVLPGATGVSPQGTIMAFAHEILARHICAPAPVWR
ncbi:GMC family oxidoreductase N-terminal domain-containing protein (plasmid) [Embleya sp. NBC_00888]|uniref:GMC family oxidoreductase N-terminal domain-containing protein n=1 Tax=Embleya sp. NBC_00888 TaxID=2975960 RepID=UPI002F9074E5|nr:GMC family oxidoreductase N-terminal domain-containing protein [Embleya sp. NBC_00888]